MLLLVLGVEALGGLNVEGRGCCNHRFYAARRLGSPRGSPGGPYVGERGAGAADVGLGALERLPVGVPDLAWVASGRAWRRSK